MKIEVPQKLLLFLIADDLLHYKLVRGLEKLDLKSHLYYAKLDVLLFELMGFEEIDAHEDFSYYLKRRREVNDIRLEPDRSALNALALDIYTELERRANAK